MRWKEGLDPGNELLRPEALRRLGRGVIFLRDDHVTLQVDVHSQLDRGCGSFKVVTGGRLCSRPFVMNDCFKHTIAGELPRSPAIFHAIQALQRTAPGRHACCSPQSPPRSRHASPPLSLSLGSLGD